MKPDPYIARFLNNLGKTPLLTSERERELSRIIQAARPDTDEFGATPPVSIWGCDAEVAELTNANLCLVAHNAKRYQSINHTFFDFYQEGVIGLLDAIARYDGAKGYRFSTYATFYIRRCMSRLLCKGVINVPVGYHVMMSKRGRVYGAMCIELGRNPTEKELMEKCVADGIFDSERSYQTSIQSFPRVVSGDALLRDSDETTLFDTIADDKDNDDALCIDAMRDVVNSALDNLPKETRDVICLKYGIGTERATSRQIAHILNHELPTVKNLKIKGLRRLRRPPVIAILETVR